METGKGVDKGKPVLSLDESDEFDLPEVDQKRRQSGGDNIERRKWRKGKSSVLELAVSYAGGRAF
ncbi:MULTISPECIES: hypothetical protein [Bacillus amyloliquefaciens group]|uniref:hypothetical protein n=1 Tax=Bacillus amyloliquefaciens group TaxID=1938374 RepID=UPI00057BF536|nr:MULTISPECIES: hypothetical protein [Bacillus amyloliquefaciens group]AKF75436.1 hypothetical protein AAV30_04225 [Bacillus velezensis]MEB3986911.1 hypothetical protein [Bacillus velezensis]MEC2237844.1 hypothetical protein [Bacillus velezensis]POR14254.1 hypothetical protein B9W23_10880 [Bacillus velezensis]QCE19636.1 hypothetical protein SB21_15365 [Bacillus velezensis]